MRNVGAVAQWLAPLPRNQMTQVRFPAAAHLISQFTESLPVYQAVIGTGLALEMIRVCTSDESAMSIKKLRSAAD